MTQRDLRDYQEAAINSLRSSLASGNRRVILQMPTGAGKTATAAAIIRSALGNGKRIIFTVPALSLIEQTIESFKRDGIYDIGVIQGIHELTDRSQPVQICSVQTLSRRFLPQADLVLIDEAHVVFKLYDRWFNDPEWKNIPIIGLTATPWTKGLGKLYQDLVIGTTTQQLIDSNFLSPFRVFAPTHPDLEDLKTVAGDYDLDGLDKAMNKTQLTADIVQTWLEKGESRPTLCFAVNRAHAANISDAFNKAGIRSGYMDGMTPVEEREEMFASFRDGQYKILCNVGVLTTGVDLPLVSCLILARPTKSEILFTQIMGRGLRVSDGKADLLVLDHSDTTQRLGFVTDIHHDQLDDGTKRVSSGSRDKDDEPLPKECPSCTYLRPAKVKVCPNCGFEPKPLSGVRIVEGELKEVKGKGKNKTYEGVISEYDQREKFFRELIGIAKEKRYKQGWAYFQYRDRYQKDPEKTFLSTPLPPSLETTGWVKHMWIKKRKAAEKRNAFR